MFTPSFSGSPELSMSSASAGIRKKPIFKHFRLPFRHKPHVHPENHSQSPLDDVSEVSVDSSSAADALKEHLHGLDSSGSIILDKGDEIRVLAGDGPQQPLHSVLPPLHLNAVAYIDLQKSVPSVQMPVPQVSDGPAVYMPIPQASVADIARPRALQRGVSGAAVANRNSTVRLKDAEALNLHVEKVERGIYHNSRVKKVMDSGTGDKVEVMSGAVSMTTRATNPAASSIVDSIKNGIDTFLDGCPRLIGALDEIAKLHPAVAAVVVAFNAVYSMWKLLRDNDKRVISLYVSMKDLVALLLSLPLSKDSSPKESDPAFQQMKDLSDATAKDIEACANTCDVYIKKSSLLRVLRGLEWDVKLASWVETFTERRLRFMLALSVYTAKTTQEINERTAAINMKIDDLSESLRQLLRSLAPKQEKELTKNVLDKGGAPAVIQNEAILRELFTSQTGQNTSITVGLAVTTPDRDFSGHASRTRPDVEATRPEPPSTYDFDAFKKELLEGWQEAINRNLETFQTKFIIEQQRLYGFISAQNDRLLAAIKEGPYELIKDEALRTLWKDMNWRLNVKSWRFVMTLRDHYQDAVALNNCKDNKAVLQTDNWAFQYINVSYMRPIMEAFDDDGSGYTTVFEVNRFVDSLPLKINWTLPHWIAYWAIGWELVSAHYCKMIQEIFAHMFDLRGDVLPENRNVVEFYLRKVWRRGIELITPIVGRDYDAHRELVETRFQAYVLHEESRISSNLQRIKYHIDALDTLYVVAGPEQIDKSRVRIEKHVYPLLYLVLKRDLAILHLAKTKVLHEVELRESVESIEWIYYALALRYEDLEAHYERRWREKGEPEADKPLKTIAGGMFEFFSAQEGSALFSMANLETHTFGLPNGPIPIDKSERLVGVLNYPPRSRYRVRYTRYPALSLEETGSQGSEATKNELQRKCNLYECHHDPPADVGSQVMTPVKAILGQWTGFLYTPAAYPSSYMYSFHFYASEEGNGFMFKSSGFGYGVEYTVSGTCEQDCDGNISLRFSVYFLEDFGATHFSCHLLPDGTTLVGTAGYDEEASTHPFDIIFKRVAPEIMCHRPSPVKFQENKARALWEFCRDATLAGVRRKMWSCSYLAKRRYIRQRHDELNIRQRYYGRRLDEQEFQELREGMQAMTTRDLNFYRLVLDWQLILTPDHQGFTCDTCKQLLGGARLMCLDCFPKTGFYWETVDFCDNPACYNEPVTRKPLEKPHTRDHDMVKVRLVIQYRDLPETVRAARRAVLAGREIWEKSTQFAMLSPLVVSQDVNCFTPAVRRFSYQNTPEISNFPLQLLPSATAEQADLSPDPTRAILEEDGHVVQQTFQYGASTIPLDESQLQTTADTDVVEDEHRTSTSLEEEVMIPDRAPLLSDVSSSQTVAPPVQEQSTVTEDPHSLDEPLFEERTDPVSINGVVSVSVPSPVEVPSPSSGPVIMAPPSATPDFSAATSPGSLLLPLKAPQEIQPLLPADHGESNTLKCNVCSNQLQQPCWFCVHCFDDDIHFFLCDDCERRMLLRCRICKGLYEQRSWYFHNVLDQQFTCNKCNSRRLKLPRDITGDRHSYTHDLVRCQPAPVLQVEEETATQETPIDGKVDVLDAKTELLQNTVDGLGNTVSILDQRVENLDDRMSRVEDCLSRMESKLELLLAHLKLDDGARSSDA